MKIDNIHRWDVSPKEAISIQRELCTRLILKRTIKRIRTVAGADMAIDEGRKLGIAGIIIYAFPEMVEIERRSVVSKLEFPYVPGLLAFREAPILLKVCEKLKNEPDVIIFDGQGIAHPRGMGIASHMGLVLCKPTIGCAKSRLVGEYREPGNSVGDWSPLEFGEKVVGAVLRTRKDVKPVFISPGHLMDLPSSIGTIIACLDRTRLPKPTREADHFVGSLERNA